ncbi:MAG: MFS transporter [Desulfosarcinaceae bacterium]|jgi:sugar phosphate permease
MIKSRRVPFFHGWLVVAGLFGVALLGPMGRYILTSLFPFVMQDPGWSRDTIGLAFTIHFWAYAIFALVIGRLLDRIGGRAIILAGGILMLFGLIGLSRVETVWQFFLIFGIVLAAAVSMTHFVPNTAIVRKWFVKKAGLATSLVTVGTVVGIGVLPPVVSRLGVLAGWRTACLICGIVIGGLIILIALFLVRNTPESMGLFPDGEMPQADPSRPEDGDSPQGANRVSSSLGMMPGKALRTKNFWYFFIVYSVTGIPLQGILSHAIVWAVEVGVSEINSGMVLAALAIPSIPIRILAGSLGDRFGKRRMLIISNLFTGLIWMAGYYIIEDSTSFFVFIVVLGFFYSAPFSLYTPFLGDIFGRHAVGTLTGAITLGHGIIGGVGPYLWGWLADTTGSYAVNCLISAGCYGIVTVFIWMIRPGEATVKA